MNQPGPVRTARAAERTKIYVKQSSTRPRKSTRSFLTAASSLGIALLIAGCTSGTGTTPPAAGTGTGTTTQTTDSGTGTPIPSPTVTGELAYIEAPELEKVLGGWAKTQQGAALSADAALRGQIPAAEKWLAGIEVNPTECGLYGIGSLKDQLDESVMAAVTLAESAGAVITVASYRDLNALVADVAAQQHLDKSCSKYTVSGEDQKISSTLNPLKVETSAPYSAGTLMVSSNEGTETKQVSVRAIDGHVMVTSARKATTNPAEATKLATVDVESILTLLRDREAQAGGTR